jgi:hypothetical protein
MRGTWQGSGTWQTGGPDFTGLVGPVVLVAVAVAVIEFVLSIIVWVAIALGVVLVLVAAGLIWWLRGAPRRKAAYDAAYRAAFEARRPVQTVTATVIPQVPAGARPTIEQHTHYHVHLGAAGPEAVHVIRSLPGTAGEPNP